MSLGSALPAEQARARGLLAMYREIGSAGAFGVMGTQVSRHLAAAPPPSHVLIRPAADRARAAGHPCADVYDHETDPDRPHLPPRVERALNLIGQHIRVPGTVTREVAIQALDEVGRWARPDLMGAGA